MQSLRGLGRIAESGLVNKAWPQPGYTVLYRLDGNFILLRFLLFLAPLTRRQLLSEPQRACVAVTSPDGVVRRNRDNFCPDVTLICMEEREGEFLCSAR